LLRTAIDNNSVQNGPKDPGWNRSSRRIRDLNISLSPRLNAPIKAQSIENLRVNGRALIRRMASHALHGGYL
jgi:hypothetical protein